MSVLLRRPGKCLCPGPIVSLTRCAGPPPLCLTAEQADGGRPGAPTRHPNRPGTSSPHPDGRGPRRQPGQTSVCGHQRPQSDRSFGAICCVPALRLPATHVRLIVTAQYSANTRQRLVKWATSNCHGIGPVEVPHYAVNSIPSVGLGSMLRWVYAPLSS